MLRRSPSCVQRRRCFLSRGGRGTPLGSSAACCVDRGWVAPASPFASASPPHPSSPRPTSSHIRASPMISEPI
ncbi:hypothetical protein ZWY2020_037919 [Hordeum vulgare]|nr:hypothetical protein ZWY2020_037919 [Hordeum vulgare]